jgi:hypothetical protein
LKVDKQRKKQPFSSKVKVYLTKLNKTQHKGVLFGKLYQRSSKVLRVINWDVTQLI